MMTWYLRSARGTFARTYICMNSPSSDSLRPLTFSSWSSFEPLKSVCVSAFSMFSFE